MISSLATHSPWLNALFEAPDNTSLLLHFLNALLTPEDPLIWLQTRPQTCTHTFYARALSSQGRRQNICLLQWSGASSASRALYHWARLHGGQHRPWEEVEPRSTRALMLVHDPDIPLVHQRFHVTEEATGQHLCADFVLEIINLHAWSEAPHQVDNARDRWLRWLLKGPNLPSETLKAWGEPFVDLVSLGGGELHVEEVDASGLVPGHQRGQCTMLMEVLAYRLDRILTLEEKETLEAHLTPLPLDGVRAYVLEATREELEVWLSRQLR